MRTGRSWTVCRSQLPGGGCLLQGVCVCSWGSAPGGASAPGGGLLWGGSALGGVCSRGGVSQDALRQKLPPPPWTESQTPVKTLPWPNFVAAGKKDLNNQCDQCKFFTARKRSCGKVMFLQVSVFPGGDFPDGNSNPKGGANLLFGKMFAENCIKMKEMPPPLDPSIVKVCPWCGVGLLFSYLFSTRSAASYINNAPLWFGQLLLNLKVREVKWVPGDPATMCPVLFKGSRYLLLLA